MKKMWAFYYFLTFIIFSFSKILIANVPMAIDITDDQLINEVMFEEVVQGWEYYPQDFDGTGLKTIISITRKTEMPVLLTSSTLGLNTNNNLKEIELFPELKTIKIGILGRYVARYKITYERQKDMAVCSSCFFMIYQDSFDNRIANLLEVDALRSDVESVEREKENYKEPPSDEVLYASNSYIFPKFDEAKSLVEQGLKERIRYRAYLSKEEEELSGDKEEENQRSFWNFFSDFIEFFNFRMCCCLGDRE